MQEGRLQLLHVSRETFRERHAQSRLWQRALVARGTACRVHGICAIVPSGMLPGRGLKTGVFDEDQREEAPR
jgi:hypothetical protein